MDRETAITVAITTIVLTLIGSWYLGGSSPSAAPDATAQAQYSPEDVRYKFQQKEEAYAKKHKGRKPPSAAAESVADEPAETSENEAPTNDETADGGGVNDESAEAPPIE